MAAVVSAEHFQNAYATAASASPCRKVDPCPWIWH